MNVGQRLKMLRKEKKLTQQELSFKLGINRSTYAKYEIGENQTDYDTLQKLADFFEVSTDYLLGRTNNPKKEDINIDSNKLNEDEFRKWLDIYRSSSPEEREAIIRQAQLTLELIRRDTRKK